MTFVDTVNANLRLKRAADIMTVLMPEIAGAWPHSNSMASAQSWQSACQIKIQSQEKVETNSAKNGSCKLFESILACSKGTKAHLSLVEFGDNRSPLHDSTSAFHMGKKFMPLHPSRPNTSQALSKLHDVPRRQLQDQHNQYQLQAPRLFHHTPTWELHIDPKTSSMRFFAKHSIVCLKLFLIRVNKFHRISSWTIYDHIGSWTRVMHTLRTVESELPLSCCRFMSISPKHRAESQTQTPDSLSKQRSTPMTSSSVKLTKETHEPCNIQFQWDKWTRKLGAPPELLYSRQHAWRAVGTHTILSCEKYVYIYIYTCKPH